jgi:hypothetical protein
MAVTSAPDPVAGTFAGASSIALRFAGFEQYQQAVLLYSAALGKPVGAAPPASPPSYSIRISDTLELLCVWQNQTLETNCTIVYWGVGTEPAQIDAACAALVAKGYTLLEPPGKSPLGSGDKENTQRAVLKDKSGQRVGVIINPPVPYTVASEPGIPQMQFPVEPTHVINPPVTVNEEESSPARS